MQVKPLRAASVGARCMDHALSQVAECQMPGYRASLGFNQAQQTGLFSMPQNQPCLNTGQLCSLSEWRLHLWDMRAPLGSLTATCTAEGSSGGRAAGTRAFLAARSAALRCSCCAASAAARCSACGCTSDVSIQKQPGRAEQTRRTLRGAHVAPCAGFVVGYLHARGQQCVWCVAWRQLEI